MANTGEVSTDPLFVGLTRPALFLGVSYMYFVINAMISVIYFINSSDFKVIVVAVTIHLIGYLICYKEPLFVELFLIRGRKCSKCVNKFYHGANSYDL
jgi:type IV secretion system protein VirB3